MEYRKGLYRSRTDSVIGGIAGGIAKYLNTDPTIIRILFVLLAIFGGGGILIYLILWIAVPIEPAYSYNNMDEAKNETGDGAKGYSWNHAEVNTNPVQRKQDGSLIAGLAMIAVGVIFLVDRFVPHIDFEDLWPIILLAVGVALIRISYQTRRDQHQDNDFNKDDKKEETK